MGTLDGKHEEEPIKEVKEAKPEEPQQETRILDVFKCNKCNHAFEKINLFVKHFIKVHKDGIEATKNSSSFSFSNYWTKLKVKASVKKKPTDEETASKAEIKPDVKKDSEITNIKPKKIVSVIEELKQLNLFKVHEPVNITSN